MAALSFVLAYEDRRPKWLPSNDLDLSFLSDRDTKISSRDPRWQDIFGSPAI